MIKAPLWVALADRAILAELHQPSLALRTHHA